MKELLLRTSAPALVVVFEVEGVTRLVSTAQGAADADRLETWLDASPARARAAACALRDRDRSGGPQRQREWAAALAAEPGGVVAAAQELLAKLTAAEARAREHHAGMSGAFERLRRRLRSLGSLG